MEHGVNQQQTEDPLGVAWNQRLGLRLFVVYAILYFAYIGACVVWPTILDAAWIGGVANSVVFGFGLILLAMVLALIYGVTCRSTERLSKVEVPTQVQRSTADGTAAKRSTGANP